ncbi:MAG: NAD-dependent epimerase/dehydratase family protein [Bacilli bacterium]
MKNAIVTGGAGFIGSNLVKILLDDGYNVTVLDVENFNDSNLIDIIDKIDVYEYNGDLDKLLIYFNNKTVDVIFHLASCIVGFHTINDVDRMLDSNIKLGVHMLELMKKNNIKYFINTGTFSQHFTSTDEYIPTNLYAATKQAFIDMMKYYSDVEKMKCLTLKLFDNYSEKDIRIKLINLIAQNCGTDIETNLTLGEQDMNLTHAEDVCRAFVCAHEYLINSSETYEEFYVYSPVTLSVKDTVKLYEEVNGCQINVNWGGKDYRPMEIMKLKRAYKTLPNWHPRISLENGFKKLGDSLK